MSESQTKKISVVKINDQENEIHHIEDEQILIQNIGPKFGSRHVQSIIMAVAFVGGLGSRANLSVAIVAMTDNTTTQNPDIPDLQVPWKKIFAGVPLYALIGYAWGYAILMTETPIYLANATKFDLQTNALLNSGLTAISMVGGLITGPLSDWIIYKKLLSTLNARILFNSIGSYGQALCLIWLSFLHPSQSTLSIIVLGLGNVLVSFILVGYSVNHLDLSPRFSGIIFGIVNAIAMGVSIIGPLSANWIVTDTVGLFLVYT